MESSGCQHCLCTAISLVFQPTNGSTISRVVAALGSQGSPLAIWHYEVFQFMKIRTMSIVTAASILLVGCSEQSSSSNEAAPLANEGITASVAVPVLQPAMTSWQQGDKSAAVSKFLEADWSARPLFPANSPMGLSLDQIKALSAAEKEAQAGQMASEVGLLNALLVAAMQAGDDAAAKGDTTQARKYFTALQQCGAVLASPQYPIIVQPIGQAFEARAKAKLAKMGQ